MNNKTYIASENDIQAYANKAVVDCMFTFSTAEGDDFVFENDTGLFLTIFDRKDGKILKEWYDSTGLDRTGNIINWNERDINAMAFYKGKYFYEIGYTIQNYSIEDKIVLSYGEIKFI